MIRKTIMLVFLLLAPAGGVLAQKVRVEVDPKFTLFSAHKFVNRIVFLRGQNTFHGEFVVDFKGETTDPTQVVAVFTPTVHGDQYVEMEAPEGATAVVVLTDGDKDDYKPINKTVERLPGRRTRLFWGGSKLDKLADIGDVLKFEVKEKAAADVEDEYLLKLFHKVDAWVAEHGPKPEPKVIGAGDSIRELRVVNAKDNVPVTHVVFSDHVVTENNNGYPLPKGNKAETYGSEPASARTVLSDEEVDFDVPDKTKTAILLNLANDGKNITCLGIVSFSEVGKKVSEVRGGWKVKYEESLHRITITADAKGDDREEGFYDPSEMPWLHDLIQQR